MLRRHACVAILVLVAVVAACENHAVVASGGGTLLASRAAAIGEFPDNPLLAFAPADTPYAFASFKPVPLDVIRKMTAMARPIWRRAFTRSMSRTSGAADSDAPEALADARGLSGSLAGMDRLLGQKPAMAMAVAANLEHGRAVLAHVAGALLDLGQRCQVPSFVDGVAKLATAAGRPLPPEIAGLRGGFVVLNSLKMGPRGPESIDGFGSLQLDHTGALLKDASREVPDLVVQPDGKAHALPPASPFPGHVAANEHAIGVGLGPNSATAATGALEGTAAPAPLALIVFDYGRMGDLILASETGADAEDMRAVIQAFGLATLQLLVDARGVVSWTSIELR